MHHISLTERLESCPQLLYSVIKLDKYTTTESVSMTIMVKLRPCSLCVTFEYVYNIAHLFTGIPFQVYVVSNEFCIIIIVNIPIEIVRINIVSIIE